MVRSWRPADWSTAILAIGAGLHFLRDILTPFAMAVILWFIVDSLAHVLEAHLRLLPSWLAKIVVIAIVIATTVLIAAVVMDSVAKFALKAGDYQARADSLLAQAFIIGNLDGAPPTIHQLMGQVDLRGIVAALVAPAQNLTAGVSLTVAYVAFMFSAAAAAPQKLDSVFSVPEDRERARRAITAIRQSIRSYLLIQTVASFVASALTFITLLAIGLDNALYWAILIFFLNFIPVVGPIAAVALPTAFALIQFSDLGVIAATALGIGVWPFLIGNFVLPRVTGRSLNLSPLVVLLALSFWATVWGVVGAFLAIPLSVMIMIVFAQFPVTRPLAIIMSSDGQPLNLSSTPAKQ